MARFVRRVGPEHYQTWQIAAPRSTHWRSATCAEVDCPNYRNGWKTIVPAGSDLEDLARRSGRAFAEKPDGNLIEFTFHAGQPCFRAADHRMRVERPELFVVRGGDARGNPRGIRPKVYDKPYQWVDDMHTHLDRLKEVRG